MWVSVTKELEDVKQETLVYGRIYIELGHFYACCKGLLDLCPGDARIEMKRDMYEFNDTAWDIPMLDELYSRRERDNGEIWEWVNDEYYVDHHNKCYRPTVLNNYVGILKKMNKIHQKLTALQTKWNLDAATWADYNAAKDRTYEAISAWMHLARPKCLPAPTLSYVRGREQDGRSTRRADGFATRATAMSGPSGLFECGVHSLQGQARGGVHQTWRDRKEVYLIDSDEEEPDTDDEEAHLEENRNTPYHDFPERMDHMQGLLTRLAQAAGGDRELKKMCEDFKLRLSMFRGTEPRHYRRDNVAVTMLYNQLVDYIKPFYTLENTSRYQGTAKELLQEIVSMLMVMGHTMWIPKFHELDNQESWTNDMEGCAWELEGEAHGQEEALATFAQDFVNKWTDFDTYLSSGQILMAQRKYGHLVSRIRPFYTLQNRNRYSGKIRNNLEHIVALLLCFGEKYHWSQRFQLQ